MYYFDIDTIEGYAHAETFEFIIQHCGRLQYHELLEEMGTDDTSLLLGQYTALKTSGSTGNPLPMVRDDYHNKIHGMMMAQLPTRLG